MENNLIRFFVVGKCLKNKDLNILTISKTKKGWTQNCKNPTYNFEYLSSESVVELLEWFKLDFSSYRMFQDLQEAMEYTTKKSKAYNLV